MQFPQEGVEDAVLMLLIHKYFLENAGYKDKDVG